MNTTMAGQPNHLLSKNIKHVKAVKRHNLRAQSANVAARRLKNINGMRNNIANAAQNTNMAGDGSKNDLNAPMININVALKREASSGIQATRNQVKTAMT